LLLCVEYLVKLGSEFCGSSVSYVNFSRRNFFYPDQQPLPHGSWEDETACLKYHFPEGDAFIFGPRSCDHHYVFVADYQKQNPYYDAPPRSDSCPVLEILMTNLDRPTMEQFYMKPDFTTSAEVTRSTGILDLMPGALLDDHQFKPLGYSLNGLEGAGYYTIHITPQPECSFVSFETNTPIENYKEFVQRVVAVFKPESFTVLLFSETKSSPMEELGTAYEGFYLRNSKHHKFSPYHDYNLTFCSYRQYGTITPTVTKNRPKRVINGVNNTTKPVKDSTDSEMQAISVLT